MADAGDAQANTIMNAEAARGQKRRDALRGTHAYYDKLDSERERHRLSKQAISLWRGNKHNPEYKNDILSHRLPRAHMRRIVRPR